jgi:hypothetical protein
MPVISIIKILIILTTCLLVATGCSRIAIRTAIEIEAPREQVYAILADFAAYPEWNPYHRSVRGNFVEGAELAVEVIRPDGKQVSIPPHLLRIVQDRELSWGGGIRGIFHGEHRFLLSPTASGGTLLEHNEDFSGIAIGFADLPPDVIAEGYQLMNRALKARAEATDRQPASTRLSPSIRADCHNPNALAALDRLAGVGGVQVA